jgi:GSCFA family
MSLHVIPGIQAWAQWRRNRLGRWPSRTQAERLLPLAAPDPGELFELRGDEKVFCIGSCFAREIETTMARLGFDVLSMRADLPPSANRRQEDRRLFNKYTVGAILNELRWALAPDQHPYRHDDVLIAVPGDLRWSDHQLRAEELAEPRPEAEALRSAVNRFFARVREAELVVLTLGLSEAWFDNHSGLYLNVAPSEHLVRHHPGRFDLHVLDAAQTLQMLAEIDALLRTALGPRLKLLLTVSPVPLSSTFRAQDVLLANSYSKSLLRSCCDAFVHGRPHVRYFPSYECAMLSDPALVWRSDDLRHVAPDFVDYLMASALAGLGDSGGRATRAREAARERLLTRLPGPIPAAAPWTERWKAGAARVAQGLRRAPPSTIGHLDRWTGQELIGWAADSRQAGEPVEVLVKVDGRVVARCQAADERLDVARELGDEFLHSGFHVSIDGLPADARTLTVHVGGRLLKSIALPPAAGRSGSER